jgi:acyl carrier protein
MPDELAQRVIGVMAATQHIAAESIQIDSTFEELKIDSLDGINIVFALENEFDINIPDESAQKIRSVREMVEGVRQLVDSKNAEPQAKATT